LPPESDAFSTLSNRVSLQVFKINGNVTGISKLVDLLGSSRDTPAVRKKLSVPLDVGFPEG
jgi:hypothetical protein